MGNFASALGCDAPQFGNPTAVPRNSAFLFIKPHANTAATRALVRQKCASHGISVLTEGSLAGEKIDAEKLIDQHYYAIASKATILKPADLAVPVERFEKKFGISWAAALESSSAFNAMDACAELGVDVPTLDAMWKAATAAGDVIKFGGGFYCGRLSVDARGKPLLKPLYVFVRRPLRPPRALARRGVRHVLAARVHPPRAASSSHMHARAAPARAPAAARSRT